MMNKKSSPPAVERSTPTTVAKALEVNRNPALYGAFAEIGAGQETARFFFQAGQASQTIAKTISAYDMTYSDEIYGKEASGRYVCESRLLKMLDKEHSLLIRRLHKQRGDRTQFFAFANTVATGSANESSGKRSVHGWIGVRFQNQPNGHHNDIVMHIRMLDRHRLQQQEVLGITGVNLVHAAFFHLEDPKDFVTALVENIKEGQLSIDMIRFTGPDVSHFNNQLLNLELVRRGLCEAVLFGPESEILSVSDTLFGRCLLVERGSFRPVTNSHVTLVDHATASLKKIQKESEPPLVLFEMTMHKLQENETSENREKSGKDDKNGKNGKSKNNKDIDEQDFLDRVRAIASTGNYTLVSNFFLFYRVKRFLRQYTKKPIAMTIGASLLDRLFDEAHYSDLEGGILEGLGKLLDANTPLLIHPTRLEEGHTLSANTWKAPGHLQHLWSFFQDQGWAVDLSTKSSELETYVSSQNLLHMIRSKDKQWEKLVPATVAQLIKTEGLFGHKK